jgi:hypothetical protein
MNARRLEEAFEECVTACLEGRRSIDESLSLYPSFAAELAPLLRTAVRLSDSFQKVSPPARVQERGLQRFLADARARRRLRELTAGTRKQGWLAGFWGQHRLAFAGAATLVAVLAIAGGSAAMLAGGGSDGGPTVLNVSPSPTPLRPTPEAVANIQNQIGRITALRANGKAVTTDDLGSLTDATSQLRAASPSEVQQSIGQVQDVLQAASSLVTNIAASQPEVALQAQQAQDTIRSVASSLRVPLPSTTPAPSGTPGATAQPTPVPASVSPTAAPTVAPTSAPTPEPTGATATAAPEPTDTPVYRGLPGG